MIGGFEVHPEALLSAAAVLRVDAVDVGRAGSSASLAAGNGSGSAGEGPLGAALKQLADELALRLHALADRAAQAGFICLAAWTRTKARTRLLQRA